MKRYEVGIICCGNKKQDHPTRARHLYIGSYFRTCRIYIESKCDEYVILSSLHGVLRPDQIVAPYELTLKSMTGAERQTWAEKTRPNVESFVAGRTCLGVVGRYYDLACKGIKFTNFRDRLDDGRMGYQKQRMRSELCTP